jgi:hypothetical protein
MGEVGAEQQQDLWLKGGFPRSFLAPDEARSMRWRLDFVRTFLERDVPQFGLRVAAGNGLKGPSCPVGESAIRFDRVSPD